jgi:putative methionine-R-sulfoxide reductase with GAF domain
MISDLENSKHFRGIHKCISKGIMSELAVPMLAGEQLLGVLNLECVRKNAFSPYDVRTLWHVADQAAIACLLCEEEVSANREVGERLIQLYRADSPAEPSFTSLNDLAGAAHGLLRHLGVQYLDIWWYNIHSGRFEAAGSSDPGFKDHNGPRKGGWSHYIRRTNWPVWITNMKLPELEVRFWNKDVGTWQKEAPQKELPQGINSVLRHRDADSELGVPILDQSQQCIGVMWLKYAGTQATQPLDETMSSVIWFAKQAAQIMEHRFRNVA